VRCEGKLLVRSHGAFLSNSLSRTNGICCNSHLDLILMLSEKALLDKSSSLEECRD
jgi:hypothetical protein